MGCIRRLGALALSGTFSLCAATLSARAGRPVVDAVYVNGHGPFRFLVDTGSNVNLIETGLARKIGMITTFRVDLASASGKTPTAGGDDNEVVVDSARAGGQRFLFSPLETIRSVSPDIQGVIGQWFLAQFDYTLDFHRKRIEFGKQDTPGTRVRLLTVNARPLVSTSLGNLALDSGVVRVLLFGVPAGHSSHLDVELRTIAGPASIGTMSKVSLFIAGRQIWDGAAVVIPNRPEPGVDGLMPLSLFKTVYVCNSEGYAVLE